MIESTRQIGEKITTEQRCYISSKPAKAAEMMQLIRAHWCIENQLHWVLDGKRATTHWSVSELLGSRYPKVIVEPDMIFTREGAFWTSAGVTASIDLALALVEEDLGQDVALAVPHDMVVYLKRPGGQSQFSVHLASQMNELARRMLEDAELPLKTVATRCGFASDNQLRRVFQKRLGITPRAYRERFSTTGMSLGSRASSERSEEEARRYDVNFRQPRGYPASE